MEENMVKVLATVKKEMYRKDDFAIMSFEIQDVFEGEPYIDTYWNTWTAKGNIPSWEYNVPYTIIAKEVEPNKYGRQYEIISMIHEMDFSNKQNQKIFLSKILTEIQLNNLYKTIDSPFEAIEEHDIETLCKVKGIGEIVAKRIIDKYEENKDYSTAYVELDKLGLTTNMVKKLCESYGNPNIVLDRIKNNPYLIADEVNGIGWKKADEIALSSGYNRTSSKRIMAFINYYLQNEALNGNTYCYKEDLFYEIEDNLGEDITEEIVDKVIETMKSLNIIWQDEEGMALALTYYKNLEDNTAKEIIRLIKTKDEFFNYEDWEEKIKQQEQMQGWNYTDQQKQGIKTILDNNVVLIQGYAGTGKSSIVSGILNVLSSYSSKQCALSGKASVNLTQNTGKEGFTIHRLLEYTPKEGFLRNENSPLETHIVILDEISMVDVKLFNSLVKAIPNGAKLILLGDSGQLESMGVGNLMKDLINSGVVPIVNLDKIHRQAEKSAIITNSIDIWNGKQIIDKDFIGIETRGELQDLTLDITKDKQDTSKNIMKYFKELYPTVNDIMDLQVIVPVKERGECCVVKLNNLIQEYIRDYNNYSKDEECISVGNYELYKGDKVINVRNNYDTKTPFGEDIPIMNGNFGIITSIESSSIVVEFEKIGKVVIPSEHLKYIELGYVATTHKLQGSGIKKVICGLDSSHYTMLSKEMLYTMLTRAKEYCVLCGDNKAIRKAITINKTRYKQTFLEGFLQKYTKSLNKNYFKNRFRILPQGTISRD